MAMGEAAGVAAAMALDAGVTGAPGRRGRAAGQRLRAQGADPGDQTGRNADIPAFVAQRIAQREAA